MSSRGLISNNNSNNTEDSFIDAIIDKVINNQKISFEEAHALMLLDTSSLAKGANIITRKFNGTIVDVESLVNAKSGSCPEDCSFCAQSSFYNTGINKYQLLPTEKLIELARNAKNEGSKSFCLVCAYRAPPEKDFEQICEAISKIKDSIDIDVNVSLGFMTLQRAKKLKSLGVKRYNHNLETAKSYFSQICTTHDYLDRINTAKIVKEAGLELCCGGIIGMGESQEQRLELSFCTSRTTSRRGSYKYFNFSRRNATYVQQSFNQ